MATRRDLLPRLTDLQVGKEELGHHYDTIYTQFSSVSHFDAYSIQLLRLHKTDDGELGLETDDLWPGLLICRIVSSTLFSALRQCVRSTIKMQRSRLTSFSSNGIVLRIEWTFPLNLNLHRRRCVPGEAGDLSCGGTSCTQGHGAEGARRQQQSDRHSPSVMAGLVPAIHVFLLTAHKRRGCPRQARA